MSAVLTRQAAKDTAPDDLLDLVGDMPYRDLLLLPRDVVAALPADVRQMRHDRIVVPSAFNQALAIVRTATIDQLLTIDREIADPLDPATPHLPDEFSRIRKARILDERDDNGNQIPYNRERTCKLFGVQPTAIVKWRGNYLDTGQVSSSAMPQSDIMHPNTRRPHDGKRGPGASPLWYIPTLLRWGQQSGKLNDNLFPEPQLGGRPRTVPRQGGLHVPTA